MRAEKKCWPISRGTWLKLLDFFVILFEFLFVIGKVVLDFGDLKEMVSKSTLRFNQIVL
jgi:hypothetical protein